MNTIRHSNREHDGQHFNAAHRGIPDANDKDEDEDGFEIENDEPDAVEIHEPFNPETIDVLTKSLTINLIISRIDNREIDLAPDFQRLEGIWSKPAKSRLIESLLLRIPIPVFYVAADVEDCWAVVDGVQRLSTIHRFVKNEFPLNHLQYLTQFDGLTFEELPRQFIRRIQETELIINVIGDGTPDKVKFNIFYRINTGGTPLNRQEIRHALHPGKIRDFLKQLANSNEFKKATNYSINNNRMADRECVLRFLAFYLRHWGEYKTTDDFDGFLSETMNIVNKMSKETLNEVASTFSSTMSNSYKIFGNEAFRKPSGNGRKKPINKSLFESWSVNLARCSDKQLENLIDRPIDVYAQFENLIDHDQEFVESISYSTADSRRVHKRFQSIEQLLADFA